MEFINLQNAQVNQPTVNIGMTGHVSNGKSTVTRQITGVKTQKFASENERNITVRLGYANAKIYKCPTCPRPTCYQPKPSDCYHAICARCKENMILVRHVSFVDCPGHNTLMATMLNGACVMDSTVLIESVTNEKIPAAQTLEHFVATQAIGIPNAMVCINKLDTIPREKAEKKIVELKKFINTTNAANSPLVPMSANYGINLDVFCEYLCTKIPVPERNIQAEGKMIVIRSFNINKQGIPIDKLKGGVVGGSLIKGHFKIGDQVTVYPGFIRKIDNKWSYKPIKSKVLSINSEKNSLDYAVPGGLIGVQLTLDPALTSNDRLIGNIVTSSQEDLTVYHILLVKFNPIEELQQNIKIKKLDVLTINANAANIKCSLVTKKKNILELHVVDKPIAINIGENITVSKNTSSGPRVIGVGTVLNGETTQKIL